MAEAHLRTTPISRIAIVAPNAAFVLSEYNAIATAIRSNGDQVRCFSPNISREDSAQLDQQGIHTTPFSLQPERFSLFPQRRAIADLAKLLAEWKPTHLIAIGDLEIVYAIRAARKLKLQTILAIPERLPASLGKTEDSSHKSPIDHSLVKALNHASKVICLNASMPDILKANKIQTFQGKYCITPRCGVDLESFPETPLPPLTSGLIFHLSSPLEETNAILAYCKAAKHVKETAPGAEFILTGPPGQSDKAIALDALEPYNKVVKYAGVRLATKDELERCHVFLSLSYDQAMPQISMQALALGRPIIASHSIAARELVDVRVNGCLVDPQNPLDIAQAMNSFLKRPDLIPAMARASRQKAVRRLDQKAALAKLLPLIYQDR